MQMPDPRYLTGALGVLLAGSMLAAPAMAQTTTNIAPPPERFAVSPGGVDMRSGRYVYSETDLAIGGEAVLALTRTLAQQVAGHNNPFGNFSHNWDILLTEKRIAMQQGEYRHGTGVDYQIEIASGGLSDTFRGSAGLTYFEQTSRSGWAELTYSGDRNGSGAVYTYRRGDGTEAVFRPIGSGDCSSVLRCAYVSQITQADGTRLTFEYDTLGFNGTRLRSVTSSRGYALLLEFSNSVIIRACVINLTLMQKPSSNTCPATPQAAANYLYDTVGGETRLASVTDADGDISVFVNNLTSIGFRRPGESSPWLTNTWTNRTNDDGLVEQIVTSQSFADGTSYAYGFDETPFVPGHIPGLAGGSFADGQGRQTILRYGFPQKPRPSGGYGNVGDDGGLTDIVWQVTPGPVEVTDPLGRVTTTDYCDVNAAASGFGCVVTPMPVSTTDPEGIRNNLTWDMFTRNLQQTRQVARAGSGLADIVRSATYNCAPANFRYCQQPLTVTDARGAVTDFTYAPEHGGVLTQTPPAPSAGAARPQTRYEYAQRYAWVSNGAGGYVQAPNPVWLLARERLCRTTAASGSTCAGGAADEVITDYDYGANAGPNNLLLRGRTVTAIDGGVTTVLRTCFGYDAVGRRISETQPNANLAACP